MIQQQKTKNQNKTKSELLRKKPMKGFLDSHQTFPTPITFTLLLLKKTFNPSKVKNRKFFDLFPY